VCARQGVPRFGAAFCEASEGHPSMPGRRVRSEGNDAPLRQLAERNALALGAGHSFLVFIDGAFPVSVLNAIKQAPTVCRVYCATSNPTSVIVARRGPEAKGILGVIDGLCPQLVESDDDKQLRKGFLRSIGYKR
jgi:adenosine/AMP kinase